MNARTIVALLVLLVAPLATAQDIARNIVVPQSRVMILPDTQAPVSIESVDVSVTMRDRVAMTQMRITLANPSGAMQEAELLVPVPDGAGVSSFGLEGLNEGSARLLDRDEARRIYDEIVRKMRDPGLLEFIDHRFIKSSVFPVPAGGTQVVLLSFEHLCPADSGRIDYVLPRSQSFDVSGVAWTFSIDISTSGPLVGAYSPSHDVSVERPSPTSATITLDGDKARAPGALRLSILTQSAADGLATTVYTYPDARVGNNGGYFLLLAGVGDAPDRASVRREVTIVIDRSGSMQGEKFAQATSAASQVISALAPGELFNIIDYSDTIRRFADAPVERTPESLAEAQKYLASLKAVGGTNIHDALIEALRQQPSPEALPMVLFLTDGLATVGEQREHAIREAAQKANTHDRRVFSFGVGYDVNAPLLSKLSDQSRGASTFVLPDEDIEVKVGSVFRQLDGPVFTDVHVNERATGSPRNAPIAALLPNDLPDLFAGGQMVLLGRYNQDTPTTVTLVGNYLGQRRTFPVRIDPASASTANGFVPRLWASRRIAQLVDHVRQAGATNPSENPATKELVDEIVALSLEFGILTEYTSFLATEEGALPDAEPGEVLTDAFREQAREELQQRAVDTRAGKGAVNQSMNIKRQMAESNVAAAGAYIDKDMNRVVATGMQQVADRAMIRRADAWIDGRVLSNRSSIEPDETIEFGSPAYDRLVDRLVSEGRAAMLAQRTPSIYLLIDDRVVLVRNAS